jgi:small subunit ribosomal protein S1
LTPTEQNEQVQTTENTSGQSLPAKADENRPERTCGENDSLDKPSRRRILIGSERDPAAYRSRRRRDWAPIVEPEADNTSSARPADSAPIENGIENGPPQQPLVESNETASPPPTEPKAEARVIVPQAVLSEMLDEPVPLPTLPDNAVMDVVAGHFPPPNIRERLEPDQEAEFEKAMGGALLDELLSTGDAAATQEQLEIDSKHRARIVVIRKDDVFLELGRREQGVVPLQQFKEPPVVGGLVDVIVQRFNSEDGLYELMLPGTAVHVEDWSDLREGATVDVQVTGHNSGGLECEVNHIRAFIPISQVSLYRVEDLSEFVGQRFLCLVTEANPERRNLVLSRRAILEREKAEAKQKFMESLKPGQIHEGVVRKLMPFGAFVDIGNGVEGLLHVSQLAWGRVNHPSEVVAEGQTLKIRVEKINSETGKISFAYRDLLENPWTQVETKFPPNSTVRGKVVKIMDFGAFVELEPGVEGLIHISQLSHKRVFRCTDVVKEGQEVEVMVLSVDTKAQRISLSIKALFQPEPTKKEKEEQEAAQAAAAQPAAPAKPKKPEKKIPLTGGLQKTSGAKFGLKW